MDRIRLPESVVTGAAAVLLVASLVGLVTGSTKTSSDERRDASRGANSVAIVDFSFEPATLSVAVGEAVRWTNEDEAPHTVTSDGEGPLDSGNLDSGATFETSFDEPGTYDYLCTIHPTMQGTVEVTR